MRKNMSSINSDKFQEYIILYYIILARYKKNTEYMKIIKKKSI